MKNLVYFSIVYALSNLLFISKTIYTVDIVSSFSISNITQ
jgi:hypothetical protein